MASNGRTIYKQYKTSEMIANEPWPQKVILYQPFEAEQILLAENASCLAVKCFLKMSSINYQIKCCANAEFMSPGGRLTKLPFIKVGEFLFAEFENIIHFLEQKNDKQRLGHFLDEDTRSDMRAYLSLAENIFTNAELYQTFVDELTYQEVTVPRYGCVYPWPLSYIQNFKKRRQVHKILKVYKWKEMNMAEVADKVDQCCNSLSVRLEEGTKHGGFFFYGEEPTELDALVFGHLFTILTTALPNNILAKTVRSHHKLVEFVEHIESAYFGSNSVSEC